MSGEVIDFSTPRDDAEPQRLTAPSLADRIKADLAARKRKIVEVVHPEAPAWRAFYRLPSDRTELSELALRAEKAGRRKQQYHFDAALLAKFNESLEFDGEPLEVDGEPLTFRSEELMDLVGGAVNASDAVRKVYGSDGIVSAVVEQLMTAAGYGTADEVQIDAAGEPDPTESG